MSNSTEYDFEENMPKCLTQMIEIPCLQVNQSLTFTLQRRGQPHDLQHTIESTGKL